MLLCNVSLKLLFPKICPEQFWDEGYLILPDFADAATTQALRDECKRLVDEMKPSEHNTIFRTYDDTKVKLLICLNFCGYQMY